MSSQRLVVCGSFGFGNAGDEAVPLAVRDAAHLAGISLDVVPFTRFEDPEDSVIGIGERDRDRRETLRGLPLLAVGGGVVEPNPIAVAQRCGAFLRPGFASRSGLLAVNVESSVSYSARTRLRLARNLWRCRYLSTRDPDSARVLRELLPGRRVDVLGDVVLCLEADVQPPPETADLPPYIAVALAPRWENDPSFVEWLSRHLDRLARATSAPVVFVPMAVGHDDDRPVHRTIAAAVEARGFRGRVRLIDRSLPPRVLSRVFRGSLVTLGMRLHACVFAFSQRRPFVAISYHPKVRAFARNVGWEDSVVPRSLPAIQSKAHYGYAFSDTDGEFTDLEAVALHAMRRTDFGALDELRGRISEAVARFLLG